MNKRIPRFVLTVSALCALSACHPASSPLEPPKLLTEPYFLGDYLYLNWVNMHKGKEGFQGYNVYLSTMAGLAELPPQDITLKSALLRTCIGADDDTVLVKSTGMAETWLSDLDSFYVHIRCVVSDSVSEGGKEYLVYPANCQMVKPVSNLTCTVIPDLEGNSGAGLHLSWDAPQSAVTPQGYVIYIRENGQFVAHDTAAGTGFDLYTPTSGCKVCALFDEELSQPATKMFFGCYVSDGKLWRTDSLVSIFEDNGFMLGLFEEGGTISFFSMADSNWWPLISYYLDSNSCLASPQAHDPVLNGMDGRISTEQGSGGFHETKVAPVASASSYARTRDIQVDKIYALWLDVTSNGPTSDDRYGKVAIKKVEGRSVVLDIGYQPVPGLRWVVTE